MTRARKPMVRRVSGPERVDDDLNVTTLHPTKGFRRISGKRVEAQAKMPAFAAKWAQIGAAVR